MEKLICKICGKEFEYEKLRYCRAQLNRHLKVEHQTNVEDYLVKYELNGIHPKCLCGCGENVSLNKNWKWNKYAKENGFNFIRLNYEKARDINTLKYIEKCLNL